MTVLVDGGLHVEQFHLKTTLSCELLEIYYHAACKALFKKISIPWGCRILEPLSTQNSRNLQSAIREIRE
jgi:hypothetical protein